MKLKSFILAALFLVGFATMQAQERRGMNANDRVERATAQMTKQLSLSDAQVAKVKAVNVKYAEKVKALRENTQDRTQLRPEMQKLRKAQEAEIGQYLTKEQADKWATIKAEREGRREESRVNRDKRRDAAKAKGKTSPRQNSAGAAKRGKGDYTQKVQKRTERMKETLNLSDEQAKQIEAIYMEYGAKKQAAYQAGTEEARASVKEMRKEENKAVDAVLTKEQLQKREELKNQSREKRAAKKQKMKTQRDEAIEQN
jgi:hypothetical protein